MQSVWSTLGYAFASPLGCIACLYALALTRAHTGCEALRKLMLMLMVWPRLPSNLQAKRRPGARPPGRRLALPAECAPQLPRAGLDSMGKLRKGGAVALLQARPRQSLHA